ncbi:carbohydrate-binding domain-containing protein [Roseomonas gilardii]|uniref:carbohydrate-binding domain-containing protein n=1 Tax=Roseomonas gilardii TaxID=257708 RepID=UPI00119E52F3|nr:carbohydrate-binding domain-containing protein [Roseomonas gilardii]
MTLGITDHPLIVETVDSTKAEPQTSDGDGQTIMTLKMSGDDWQGAAQFTVSVDGQQQGDVYTVGAARAEGDTQDFTFHGSWGDGEHSLEITYLNDSWGGTADTDRNLYLESVSFGGTEHETGITMLTNGTYHVGDLMAS